MAANPNRSKRTDELYRYEAKRYLGDWLSTAPSMLSPAGMWRPASTALPRITVWSPANRAMSLLRSVYRRPGACVDLEGLDAIQMVDLRLAGGGKLLHRKSAAQDLDPRRGAAVLAHRHRMRRSTTRRSGTTASVVRAAYTGMRRDEVPDPAVGTGRTWPSSALTTSGSRKQRPAFPWSCPSPGNCAPILEAPP